MDQTLRSLLEVNNLTVSWLAIGSETPESEITALLDIPLDGFENTDLLALFLANILGRTELNKEHALEFLKNYNAPVADVRFCVDPNSPESFDTQTFFDSRYYTYGQNNEANDLEISIDKGSAPDEMIAELLADISILYRMQGGSGINYEAASCQIFKLA